MRNVELVAKVMQVYEVREFQTEKRSGKVGSFVVADETGSIRIVGWGDQTDNIKELKEGDIVKIESGYVRANQGTKEIHLNDKSNLQINPEGDTVAGVQTTKPEASRSNIKDLQENTEAEVLATVVQAFDPRFFEICPECNRRAKPKDADFICDTHQKVTPDYSYVMNCFLDDGTENIRAVFFRQQMEQLLDKKREEILAAKDAPDDMTQLKDQLLGTQIIVSGRIKKNQMFDRLELVANSVNINPDPKEEIQRMEKEQPKSDQPTVEEVVE